MRILVVNKFLYNNGGSETYIFNLFNYSSKQGNEIEYFGMEHQKNIVGNRLNQYIGNMDFKGNVLKKVLYPLKVIYSIEAKMKIRKVIKDFKPDVIHINNFNYQVTPSILYEIKKFNIPVIQTLHDPQLVCPYHRLYNYKKKEICEKCKDGRFSSCILTKCIDDSIFKSMIGAAESYIYRKLNTYEMINYFISPSRFLKGKMIDMNTNINHNKILVLHNFISENDVENHQNKKDYVLYFGRLSIEKGIHRLIEACKRLTEIKFVFAGGGELENDLIGVKNIKFVGFKTGEELKTLISEALFSIYPSEWYENCPMSILESQMYGTPVIGADIGGIPELIDDKIDGYLFKSGDVDDLTDKIISLYKDKDKREEFSLRCKEKVKKFSIDLYYPKLMEIYDKAINELKSKEVF